MGSKFINRQNMSMTLCRQKVTEQGKLSGFSTRLIKNSAFAICTGYENFVSDKMTQRHGIGPKLR